MVDSSIALRSTACGRRSAHRHQDTPSWPMPERSTARLGNTAADRLVRALGGSPRVGTFSPPDTLRSAINDYVDEQKAQGRITEKTDRLQALPRCGYPPALYEPV